MKARSELELKMFEAVVLSMSATQREVCENLGITRRALSYWKAKFQKSGEIPTLEEEDQPSIKDIPCNPVDVIITEEEPGINHVAFIREALKHRKVVMNKMVSLVKDSDDLDHVTNIFNAINISIEKFSTLLPKNALPGDTDIFEAGRVIYENLKEIRAIEGNTKALKENNDEEPQDD